MATSTGAATRSPDLRRCDVRWTDRLELWSKARARTLTCLGGAVWLRVIPDAEVAVGRCGFGCSRSSVPRRPVLSRFRYAYARWPRPRIAFRWMAHPSDGRPPNPRRPFEHGSEQEIRRSTVILPLAGTSIGKPARSYAPFFLARIALVDIGSRSVRCHLCCGGHQSRPRPERNLIQRLGVSYYGFAGGPRHAPACTHS